MISLLLLQIQSPYIEDFLNHTASVQVCFHYQPVVKLFTSAVCVCVRAQRDNRHILDLLWRYYEKTKAYSGAAKILDELAHKQE